MIRPEAQTPVRGNSRKLRKLTVRGFKSIRVMDAFELRDLNIVVGQNGAGKSNLIGVFRLLESIARDELQAYVARQGGLRSVLHFGPQETTSLMIDLTTDNAHYNAVMVPTAEGGLTFARNHYDDGYEYVLMRDPGTGAHISAGKIDMGPYSWT